MATSSPKASGLPPVWRLRQQALLGEFHGETDGHARRHRIEPQFVAQAVGGDDRIHVSHARRGAQGVEGLELGALGHKAGVWPGTGKLELAAAHRALVAGVAADVLPHLRLHPQRLHRSELARGRPVLRREDAHGGRDLDHHGRADLGEAGVEHRAVLHLLPHARPSDFELLLIGHGDGGRAPNGDGLEVLRPHDRPQAPPPGRPTLVDDAGHLAQILTGGTDAGDADGLIAEVVLDHHLAVRRLGAPQAGGVAELHVAVLDPQVGGLLGLALDDHGVVACEPELGGEEAARERHAHRAGERRLRRHRHPAGAGHGGAGERTRSEDELVVGTKRVGARCDLVVEIFDAESRTPDEVLRDVRRQCFLSGRAGGQVDPQDLAGVAP